MKEIKQFEDLVGVIIKDIRNLDNERLYFDLEDGRTFMLFHEQECCESVYIESIVGDLQDLIGSPILVAEEAVNPGDEDFYEDESFTWTFYKLATIKGHVDIRFYGSSNGYYSESVDFMEYRQNMDTETNKLFNVFFSGWSAGMENRNPQEAFADQMKYFNNGVKWSFSQEHIFLLYNVYYDSQHNPKDYRFLTYTRDFNKAYEFFAQEIPGAVKLITKDREQWLRTKDWKELLIGLGEFTNESQRPNKETSKS